MAPNNDYSDTQAETVRSGTDVLTLCQEIPKHGTPELIAAFPKILQRMQTQRGQWTPAVFLDAVQSVLSGVGSGKTNY